MDSSNPSPDRENNDLDLNTLSGWQFGTAWSQDKAELFSGRKFAEKKSSFSSKFNSPRENRGKFGAEGKKSDGFAGEKGNARPFRKPFPRGESAGATAGNRPFSPGKSPFQSEAGKSEGSPRRFHRGSNFSEERRPFVPPTADFTVTFYPDDGAFSPVSTMMKQSRKTYEAFRMTQMFLSKPDRFVFLLRKNPEATESFYFLPLAEIPFSSRDEAIEYLLHHHLADLFAVEERQAEAPKGIFSVVHRCPFTKKLLCAPNYHRYRELVREHHRQHVHHLPFEDYLRRLENTREPEDIQNWTTQMCRQPLYFLKISTEKNHGAVSTAEENSSSQRELAEKSFIHGEIAAENLNFEAPMAEESQNNEASPENNGETSATEVNANSEAMSENALAEVPSDGESLKNDGQIVEDRDIVNAKEMAPETPIAEKMIEERRQFHSLNEIRDYLLNERKDLIQEKKVLRLAGKSLEKIKDSKIRQFVQYQLHRQQKFPLETTSAMRGKIKAAGLHIYKRGRKGITYICAIPRRFRDAHTVFAAGLQEIIASIEQNKDFNAAQLCKLLCSETRPENDLLRDLSWLIHEGYVSEMENGALITYPAAPTKTEKSEGDKSPKMDREMTAGESENGEELTIRYNYENIIRTTIEKREKL